MTTSCTHRASALPPSGWGRRWRCWWAPHPAICGTSSAASTCASPTAYRSWQMQRTACSRTWQRWGSLFVISPGPIIVLKNGRQEKNLYMVFDCTISQWAYRGCLWVWTTNGILRWMESPAGSEARGFCLSRATWRFQLPGSWKTTYLDVRAATDTLLANAHTNAMPSQCPTFSVNLSLFWAINYKCPSIWLTLAPELLFTMAKYCPEETYLTTDEPITRVSISVGVLLNFFET